MMPSFLGNLDALRPFLVAAAHELGVVGAVENRDDPRLLWTNRRLAVFIAALQSEGLLSANNGHWQWHGPACPPAVASGGWGDLAQVIRADIPVATDRADLPGSAHIGAFQDFLAAIGAPAAAEMAEFAQTLALPAGDIVDLGAGLGTYGRAAARRTDRRVVLVDRAEVIHLMAERTENVRTITADLTAADAAWGVDHSLCILANVVHLYSADHVADILHKAVASLTTGGWILLKDLAIDDDSLSGRLGVLFSLNMAIYTQAGRVHPAAELAEIMTDLGLVDVKSRALACEPESYFLVGRKR